MKKKKENPSTVRSWRYREKLKDDPEKLAAYREKEKQRQQSIRDRSKGTLNERQLEDRRFNARLRQQKSREKKKEKAKIAIINKNTRINRKIRSKHTKRTGRAIEKYEEQIKTLKNMNRRKDRKIQKMESMEGNDSCSSSILNVNLEDISDSDSESLTEEFQQIPSEDASSPNLAVDAAAILYQALSPRTKRKTLKRLNTSNDFKANKLVLRKSGIRPERQRELFTDGNEQQKRVKEFIERDDNSATCPDKRKKGVRYRLALLKVLHEKYLSEYEDISFSYFCKLIPKNVVKPKPEDWGTCLCRPCINPELKLAALSKFDSGSTKTIDQFSEGDTQKVKTFVKDTAQRLNGKLDHTIEFVEWTHEKEQSVNPDKTIKNSYFSRKTVQTVKLRDFLELLERDLINYIEHISRAIAQFRKIKKVKTEIEEDDAKAMIRLDWSENLVLFQTRQEKGAYYTEIQVSLHPFVVYQNADSSLVASSFCGISDCTNHRAPATWVTLQKVLGLLNETVTDVTLVSDSPTSQYRNKFMMWYIHDFATKNKVKLTWVYTEAGHGKGPADGIGSTVKNMVMKDIIALNPDKSIRDAAAVLTLWPESCQVKLLAYSKDDIEKMKLEIPPDINKSKLVTRKGFGIGKTHEVVMAPDGAITMKVTSGSNGEVGLFKSGGKQVTKQINEIDEIDETTSAAVQDIMMENNETTINNLCEIGTFVIINYCGKTYPAEIVDVEDDETVTVKCMEKDKKNGSLWRWPPKDDIVIHYAKEDCKLASDPQLYGSMQSRILIYYVKELVKEFGDIDVSKLCEQV